MGENTLQQRVPSVTNDRFGCNDSTNRLFNPAREVNKGKGRKDVSQGGGREKVLV